MRLLMSEMVSGDSDVLPVSGIDGVVVMLFVLNTPSVNPGNSRYFIVLCRGALLGPRPGNYSHNKLSKDDNNCNFYPCLHCDVTVDNGLVPLTSAVNLSELILLAFQVRLDSGCSGFLVKRPKNSFKGFQSQS